MAGDFRPVCPFWSERSSLHLSLGLEFAPPSSRESRQHLLTLFLYSHWQETYQSRAASFHYKCFFFSTEEVDLGSKTAQIAQDVHHPWKEISDPGVLILRGLEEPVAGSVLRR